VANPTWLAFQQLLLLCWSCILDMARRAFGDIAFAPAADAEIDAVSKKVIAEVKKATGGDVRG